MTCKDCIHFNACKGWINEQALISFYNENGCDDFFNKSEFPCKVGDTIYQTDGIMIYMSRINKIIYSTNSIDFDESAIGTSVFLTKEDAEKALKERKNKQ